MKRHNPVDLIRIQLELECIGIDANNFLSRMAGENPDDIARFYAARHAAGYIVLVRWDLPPNIVRLLRSLPPQQAFDDTETVKRILYGDSVDKASVISFRSYFFEASPAKFSNVVRQDEAFIIYVEGEPVSRAWSSRSNAHAAELAVETKPAFRRRGYGHQVTSAWAWHQVEQRKVAFYSHKSENIASEALAKSLGVIHFVDGMNYE